MNEVPKNHTKVIVTDNKPGGIGEVGLPPWLRRWRTPCSSSPGNGLRDLPFDPDLLKA